MIGNFVNLYKTRKKGESSVLKLKCAWINGELNIVVIDGKAAWTGNFSAEEIDSFCEVLGITRDEYVIECQQAFSGGDAVENFLFTVENNRFVWRKELGTDTRVKFGSINLSPVPFVQALEEFVDFAFETMEHCRQEVADAKKKMGYFETERTTLLQKIEEYILNKNEIENILYSKFLCVLNAKKERIAILEQELSDLKSKIQHNTIETESHKYDTVVATEPSSKTTRQTKKTNKKPNKCKVQQSESSVAVDTKLQMSSNIPAENSDTQITHSGASKELKHKQNVRDKNQQVANINSVESRTTSCRNEDLDPCTSKAFSEQVCELDVLERTCSTQQLPSNNDTAQQKPVVIRSTSPVASTSTSITPSENHILVKCETPDQFIPEEKGTCIPSQLHADKKSPPSVKRSVDGLVSKQIKDVPGSVYSSEAKDKTARKTSEVICPIDLVSQKINTQSDVSLNNVNKITVSKNNKKIVTSPAKQCKDFEIISPLDMLVQPKPPTPSLVPKDTVCMQKSNSLKRTMQSMNMEDNIHEFSTEAANVCQGEVEGSTEGVVINDVHTNSRINTADTTSVTVSLVNHTKSQIEEENNHYDSDTDVDEPEDVCKLSAKHRSVNGILEDSNHSSLTESENPEVKCDETHQPEQKNAIENLLNDSQDTDCTSEEISLAPLPKRTRRTERINKCVPIINKAINHFTKMNQMRDKSQNVSQNVNTVLYEQETQIIDTQKLLDEL